MEKMKLPKIEEDIFMEQPKIENDLIFMGRSECRLEDIFEIFG